MRMKRLIAMLLAVVLLSVALVSCDEYDADFWRDKYPKNDDTVYDVYYDFYIIVEDGTDEPAKVTVNDSINQQIKKYNTQIKIHYLTATEYEAQLTADLAATPDLSNTEYREYKYGGRIVLINNKAMLDNYSFANLASYIESDKFGDLRPDYASPLLEAAYINGALKGIPNNRVFGGYDYIKIDREIAERKLGFSAQTTLTAITSLEDEGALALKAKIEEYNAQTATTDDDLVVSDVISLVTDMPYEYKYIEEAKKVTETDRQQWIVNVAEYPIASADEAYASAYGIIPSANLMGKKKNAEGVEVDAVLVDYIDRAMEIIYALNKDANLRNTLQYGVKGANYTVDSNGFVTKISDTDREYNMNIEYTGNVFKAYFCGTWTSDAAKYGLEQNKQSVLED